MTLAPPETAPLLIMENVTKAFPGVIALAGASLRVNRAEVHALVGQNGAGKSTLMKILNGAYRRDGGSVVLDGKDVDFRSPQAAQSGGVSTIFQEINLVPYRSVAENIFMGREPRLAGLINWRRMNRAARELLARLDVRVDVTQPLMHLNIANQQMVAIARAVSTDSKLVIMDEPTSSLDDREVETLFEVIRSLKADGVSVIFITHRLDELYAVCDRVTIMRDGRMAGLLGSGRTEVARAIFGADPMEDGQLRMEGQPAHFRSPSDAIQAGIGFCTEDRKAEGIIPHLSVRENLTLAALPVLSRAGIVDAERQREIVDRFIARLGIKTAGPDQKIRELSGGNQQKVLLARWLCLDPKLLILDEPTRGIDVGAKAEIQGLIDELADRGLGVLMISSEIEELTEGGDRVVVLRDGQTVTELTGDEVAQDAILAAMAHGAADEATDEDRAGSDGQVGGSTVAAGSGGLHAAGS